MKNKTFPSCECKTVPNLLPQSDKPGNIYSQNKQRTNLPLAFFLKNIFHAYQFVSFCLFFLFLKIFNQFPLNQAARKKRKNVPLSSAFQLGSFLPKNTSLFVRRVTKLQSNFLGYKFPPPPPAYQHCLEKALLLRSCKSLKKSLYIDKVEAILFLWHQLINF